MATSFEGRSDTSLRSGLRVAFIEPHLGCFGGIRRVLEFANRLIGRGHEVAIFLPEGVEQQCTWFPCHAAVRTITDAPDQELDVVIFNHEPQAHLLSLFQRTRSRIYYALHYSSLYNKPGSWDALQADVDLVLANSNFVASLVAPHVGEQPHVVLGGINSDIFYRVSCPKEYPILCVGDKRSWKGTALIDAAAQLLDLPAEKYADKQLAQSELAQEYSRAEVFVVGSTWEGFGWPGLEAMACGVPLVTTDNGGCREYAIDRTTALVVPQDDPEAMADAIGTLRQDPRLRDDLVRNALALVGSKFTWEPHVEELESSLYEAFDRAERRTADNTIRRSLRLRHQTAPALSIVMLTWDQLEMTQRCVESVRQHTDVDYELIIVDNGSGWEAAHFAREAGDKSIDNPRNLGFAHGMNQGLERAEGEFVAFINNDIVLPPEWATRLISHLRDPSVGVVVPAITNARASRTVRTEPGDGIERFDPFEPPPPAVVYVLRTETLRTLHGWSEEYRIASGEDSDLAFKLWVNGLDVVFDTRVLVEHRSKATASAKLGNWKQLWRENRERFVTKWQDPETSVPRLESMSAEEFAYRQAVARSVAHWMGQYFGVRDELAALQRQIRRQARRDGGATTVTTNSRRLSARMLARLRRYAPVAVPRAGRSRNGADGG